MGQSCGQSCLPSLLCDREGLLNLNFFLRSSLVQGATEKLVAGDMPIWLVKRYEDERRHKKEEEQSTVPGNTNPVQGRWS